MLFYDYHDAPNARVPRMFAAEKGIKLQIRSVDVLGGEGHRPPYNTEINRTGQVPALQLDDGWVLCEVIPICEYLEEQFPEPPLIGVTAKERAEARMWTRWIDLKYVERLSEAVVLQIPPAREHYARYNYKNLPSSDVAPVLIAMGHEKLAWFDQEMQGRQFVCGDRFTLADIHLHVFMGFFAQMGIPVPAELSWLHQHFDLVSSRPSAKA